MKLELRRCDFIILSVDCNEYEVLYNIAKIACKRSGIPIREIKDWINLEPNQEIVPSLRLHEGKFSLILHPTNRIKHIENGLEYVY